MIINKCMICDMPVFRKQKICSNCSGLLNKAKLSGFYSLCPSCGFPILDSNYICPECKNRNGLYIFTLYDYKHYFARNILFKYKFESNKRFSKLYAEILQPYLTDIDVVIPVPSSLKSLKERGWDQMYLIASGLHSVSVQPVIKVNKFEAEQKELNREDRIEYSKQKYSLSQNSISKDSRILVIDDVITTGSTMLSCCSLLKSAGFSNVKAFAFYYQL